jgi:hypothetical protein
MLMRRKLVSISVFFDGVLTADAPEREFGENRHALSPLFYAAQELITEIRTSDGASE